MIPANPAPYHLQPGQLLATYLRRIGRRSWPGDLYAIRARRLRHDLERARVGLPAADASVDDPAAIVAKLADSVANLTARSHATVADVAELAAAVAELERRP